MRERPEERDEAGKGSGPSAAADIVARLPPPFVSMIGHASPEVVATLLHTHPQLVAPILAVVQQLRGNAFAQLAVATASTHPLHRPAPDEQPSATKHHPAPQATPTNTPEPAVDREKAKILDRQRTAAWDQLATAAPDERATPTDVRLPPNIVQALEQAWQDTLESKIAYEQGGNIVHNYGGGYELRRRENNDPRQFDQDDKDVGRFQSLVAQVHTHPYREEKDQVPEQFASFSDGDFDALMRSDAHLAVLRSGPYTFMLAKTKQFNAMVDQLANNEEKLHAFAARMATTYNRAADATEEAFSEKVEAGVMAVCEQFHLVYYEGRGGDLTRKTKRSGT